jgi:hypothetical protein
MRLVVDETQRWVIDGGAQMAHPTTMTKNQIPETITAAELNNLFFVAEWKFEGAKVTALHGLDLSTEERYAAATEGSVMITVLQSNGVSMKVMVASDAVFTR